VQSRDVFALVRIAVAAAVLLGSVTRSTVAEAQSAGDRDEQARQHFERGVALIEQSRWADAVMELQAARSAAPSSVPALLFNLGLAHRALGHNQAAIEAFRAYLQSAGQGAVASRRAEVERYVNDLQAALATVLLDVTPRAAIIMVDGASLAPGTQTVELDPGRHVFTVSAPRFRSQQQSVQLAGGGRQNVRIALENADVVVQGVHPGPIVLLAGGGVVAASSIAFIVLRGGAFAAFEAANCEPRNAMTGEIHCQPQPPGGDGNYNTGSTMTVLADVTLGVGGAMVAGGVVWLALTAGRRAEPAAAPMRTTFNVAPVAGGAVALIGGVL